MGTVVRVRNPLAVIRQTLQPAAFHGRGVHGGFFEGWYVKAVSVDQSARWAFIPGVFRGRDGDRRTDEAFVQILDGVSGESEYHRYEPGEFWAATDRFDVRVGPHRFTDRGFSIDFDHLHGDVAYTTPLDPWPVTWRRPGIMGPYAWVPLMECYHGVVSFGHGLAGGLTVRGRDVDLDHGRGYIEKDWGRAFPAGYVWMHSSHLADAPDAALVASVALIPWVRSTFRGFIVGVRTPDRLRTWATYNSSKEIDLRIDDSHVHWSLEGPDGRLDLRAERRRGGLLHAPVRTRMHERVEETLDAVIDVRLTDEGGRVVLDTVATTCGLEVHGDLERLLAVGTR
jgi:tocopherol cyclase